MDPERILDTYIHDYLVKRRYNATSRIFQEEAAVPCNNNVIDAPEGFLYEWWSVFWDIFITRYKLHVPGILPSNEAQVVHGPEIEQWQQQQQQQLHSLDSSSNLQMHELLVQRKLQQQYQAAKLRSLARQSRNIQHATTAGSSYPHPSVNEGFASMPLEGWPLNVRDHFQPRLQQQQNSLMHSQAFNQYELQHNYLLQAAQSSLTSAVNDSEGRQLGMFSHEQFMGNLNGRNLSSAGEVDSAEGSVVQEGYPLSVSGDRDVLNKQTQHINENREQYRQGAVRRKLQNSSSTPCRQDNMFPGGSLPSTTQRKGQASKNQTGQKRSGHAKSTVPSNVTRSSPKTVQSTSSSYRQGGGQQLSQPPCLLDDYGGEKHASDGPTVPLDCFSGDQSVVIKDNTNMTPNGADCQVDTGGSTFSEIACISCDTQVDCCNLSSDGELVVTVGNDNKASVWSTQLAAHLCMLNEHSDKVTDACFSPKGTWLATASVDKTIKVWDLGKPRSAYRTFVGHSAPVTSLDFHPNREDLICSCDSANELRYWSIENGGCDRVLKNGGTQARFQPNHGKYIAVVGNGISIRDVETTHLVISKFEGHSLNIHSVSWDFSGELLASTSKDRIKVWKIKSAQEPQCIHELSLPGKEFRCCVFHPQYRSLLVIGCSQSLDLWNMDENKLMTPVAEQVCALTVAASIGLVASASRDNGVKLWKWI